MNPQYTQYTRYDISPSFHKPYFGSDIINSSSLSSVSEERAAALQLQQWHSHEPCCACRRTAIITSSVACTRYFGRIPTIPYQVPVHFYIAHDKAMMLLYTWQDAMMLRHHAFVWPAGAVIDTWFSTYIPPYYNQDEQVPKGFMSPQTIIKSTKSRKG